MKTGKLIVLAVVAAALAVGAWMAYQKKTASTVKDEGGIARGAALLPALDKRLPEVARITYKKGDGKIVLVRDDNHNWTIETSDNYPADPKRITEMVFNLTGLKVAEMVTARTEKYDRFGLKDAGEEGTLTIQDKKGDAIATVVRGQERKADTGPDATSRPGGRYVRTPPDARIYLINEPYFRLGTKTGDWIDSEVMSVPSGEIVALSVDSGTTQTFALSLDADEELTLKDVPKGMQVKKYEISSTRDALDPLRIEDVISATSDKAKALAFNTTYQAKLKTGTVYEAKVAKDGSDYYVGVSASYDAPVFLKDDNKTTQSLATAKTNAGKAKEAVAGFNEKHGPWVYKVSSWAGKRLMTPRSSLLEPEKKKEEVRKPKAPPKPRKAATKPKKAPAKAEKPKPAPKKAAGHEGHDH